MAAKDAVGRYGERVAVAHLLADGLQVLARNWRCTVGEVDVVARDGDCLVFCEVKTRRSDVCGAPAEAVTARKVARMRRVAGAWLAAHQVRAVEIRLDVLAVRPSRRGAAAVEHLRGVG